MVVEKAKRKHGKGGRPKRPPTFQKVLLNKFLAIKKKLRFKSTIFKQTCMYELSVQAAMSKCVEFNIAINRGGKNSSESFLSVPNLRGICEDLIFLAYLRNLDRQKAAELIASLQRTSVARGMAIQRAFFSKNNPLQSVVGCGQTQQELDDIANDAQSSLRDCWTTVDGVTSRRGPTIRDMAEDVGLTSTYEYLYFATSNFVHFNPHALMRTGWGDPEGEMTFSIQHMDGYYRNFSSFYGAILFIGFIAAFGAETLQNDLSRDVNDLLDIIKKVERWPEVVTFEEMNQRPPLYFLSHAIRHVMSNTDDALPYGALLDEVRSLGGQ